MTVCIAAMAQNYIVSASDTMISGPTISTDGVAIKQEAFAPDWVAMFSGYDITPAIPIIERAAENFKKCENTLRAARSSFNRAFQQHLSEVATNQVLGRFGINMKEFLKTGKKQLDPATFAALSDEIRKVQTDLQFLVYGFDKDGTPHLFKVFCPGVDAVFDKPGFAAIGSGESASDALLYYFNQARHRTLEETVFNVCAAKFMAERAGVGQDTFLFVSQYGSAGFSHKSTLVNDIRTEWESGGRPRVPPGVIQAIQGADIHCFPRNASIEDQLGPQSPTADPLPPPPSPGSRGGFGVS